MTEHTFKGICDEYRSLVGEYGETHVPGRLLASIYYNLELLDLGRLESLFRDREELLRVVGAYAYGMYRLLAESDRNAMLLFVKLLSSEAGGLLERLSLAPESSIMLFYASLNVEPFREYLESQGVGLGQAVSFIVKLARRLEENIIGTGSASPDDRAYVALHLSRALSEVSRILYSVHHEYSGLEEDRFLARCSAEEYYYCLLEDALRLAEQSYEGASVQDVAVLGYIQAASTLARTDLWMRGSLREAVVDGLSRARGVLDRMSIGDLLRYDALSLEGSFYYNSGWMSATVYRYDEAGSLFNEAFRRFLLVKRGREEFRLGFMRGVLVSLWNYYLMWFNHDIVTRGSIGSEKLEDARCWGEATGELLVDPPTPGMVWKLGVHAFYAYALSVAASMLLGEAPSMNPRVMELAPERVRSTVSLLVKLLSGKLDEALTIASRAPVKSIVRLLLEAYARGRLQEWLAGRDPQDVAVEYGLTVREVPILSIAGRSGDVGMSPAEALALLVLYTL